MTSVRFDRSGLQVDGKTVPLIAGEFEFWRHNPEHWRPILRQIKAMGCNQVATFICWDFHEVEPHTFVFDGSPNPMRRLQTFLDTVREEGLQVILRPGPIIDSEWPTRGPAPDVAALERSDPTFRARSAEWLSAVGTALAPYQATRGGPIVLIQLDNEVFYPHYTEASATEADSSFHIPYDEALIFRDLERWYGGRGRSHTRLPSRTVPLNALDEDQQLAAFSFLSDQVGDYLSWVQEGLLSAGVEVPCYSNVKQFCAYIDIATLSRKLTGGAAANNYVDRLRDQNDFLVCAWWNAIQRATAPFHWAPELWCGRWIEWGQDTSIFEPDHYKFCILTQAALGLRGMNYFVLVERDDWHYSPVSPIGKVRDHSARVIKELNAVFSQLGADMRIADVALVWSLRDHQRALATRGFDWTRLSSIWSEQGTAKEQSEWWDVFAALTAADIDFVVVSDDDAALAEYPIVIVPAGMARPSAVGDRALIVGAREVVPALLKAGAHSSIRAIASRIWTGLYRQAGEELVGFCVNPTYDLVVSELEIDTARPPQLEWIVEPMGWDPEHSRISLAPRSVVAFRLRSPLQRRPWRVD